MLAGLSLPLRAAQPAARDETVTLPPFVVEQSTDEPWSILRAPGYEMLTELPTEQSKQFLRDYSRFYKLLALVCPDELRAKSDVPERILLYRDGTELRSVQQLAAEIEKAGGDAAAAQRNYSYTAKRFARSLMLRDADGSGLFVMLPQSAEPAYDSSRALAPTTTTTQWLTLSLSQLASQLEAGTPRPPRWFIDGFLGLYQNMSFTSSGVVLNPLYWISKEDMGEIKQHPDRPPKLFPLAAIFAGEPRGEDPMKTALRRAEAALFIRWCLDSRKPHAAALWQFVAEASLREPDEEMFRRAFQLSETEVLESVGDYLPTALEKSATLRPSPALKDLPLQQRRATKAEVARIKGDWQRLEIDFVRTNFPAFLAQYSEQARHTLLHAYDAGERDPNLLAVIGLYECDVGDYAAARKFLEPAAAAKVVRPRAYFELARLRLAEAPARLDDTQAKPIRDLLDLARAQSPAQSGTYLLFCQLLARRSAGPDEAEKKILEEGLRLFPDDATLQQAVAGLKR